MGGQRLGYSFLLVVLISAWILLFNLGGLPLTDPDEPVYAETAKEMIQFNDYLSPRIFGEFWYDKPPMYYWLAAGSFKLFGISEFTARFPSALAGILCVLAVYVSACRLFNERAGMLSALVLATSLEFFYVAKGSVTDMTLTLFLTVALLAFLEKRYYLFYIGAALATVTKGPIGLVFPGTIIFLHWLLHRNFKEIWKMKLPAGILIYMVIAVPWYWLMYQHHGADFIDTFFGFHNFVRFTQPEHNETSAWYFFVPVLIAGFMPWTAVMVQALWRVLTEGTRSWRSHSFLLVWAAFIFVFFSISQTKLVSYILPVFPPLAMLVGWYLDMIWEQRYGSSRPFAWPVLLTVLGGLLSMALIMAAKEIPALMNGAIAASVVFLAMILGVWYAIFRRAVATAFWIQVFGMIVFSMLFMVMLLPPAVPMIQSRDISEAFRAQYDGSSEVYVDKFLRPGFAFYSGTYGREIKKNEIENVLDSEGKAYIVTRISEFKQASEEKRQKTIILVETGDKVLLLKQ
ncbi:MAG: hypothetical protein H6Q75_988 [Firmicutes bacterium]|nr:hypothetical protein [Bacillota bacterium]